MNLSYQKIILNLSSFFCFRRGDSIPYGKVIESSSISSDGDTSPYVTSLRSLGDGTENLLKNNIDDSSRLASRSVSPGSSANLPPRKLSAVGHLEIRLI